MKKSTRTLILAGLVAAVSGLSACTSSDTIDTTVGIASGTTKIVAKGAVGAGKLAYKGGKAAIGG